MLQWDRLNLRNLTINSKVAWLVIILVLFTSQVEAEISGRVLEEGTLNPIPDARVHLQADPLSPIVFSAVDGSFTLPVNPVGIVNVSAAVEYDISSGTNWNTATRATTNGSTNVVLLLPRLPVADDPGYVPPTVSNSCQVCHDWQVDNWLRSNHSFAGEDVWVRDLYDGAGTVGGNAGYVFLNSHDPGETGFCASCHIPLADAFNPGNTFLNAVTSQGALEGVSCLACHQVDSIDGDINAFHAFGNVSYRFPNGAPLATERFVWGPLDDISTFFMSATFASFFETPEFCASCHQYDPPFGQNTYDEWLASPYSDPTGDFRTCQTCHMPQAVNQGLIANQGESVYRPAEQRNEHSFVGATLETLQAAINLGALALQDGSLLRVTAEVSNVGAGHAFPAGVSVRNALVVVTATIDGVELNQIAGPTVPFWASDDVPGDQPGDYAGWPGTGFAKVNQGRINGSGPVVSPVLFIDAESLYEHSVIPAGATDTSVIDFTLPGTVASGSTAQVVVRLLYRRAFRALAVTKGWTETPQGGPIEIEVARHELEVVLQQNGSAAVPANGPLAMVVFSVILVVTAIGLLKKAVTF